MANKPRKPTTDIKLPILPKLDTKVPKLAPELLAQLEAPSFPTGPDAAIGAHSLYERIQQHIREAEAELEDGQVLALFQYLPSGEALRVTSIGFHNMYLMRFYCEDAQGNECDVLVHFESAHLVLRRYKPTPGQPPARPIGFRADD
jgi:hypothetical protein